MGETESNAPIDKAIERFWEIMTEFGKAIDQSNQETNMNLRNPVARACIYHRTRIR